MKKGFEERKITVTLPDGEKITATGAVLTRISNALYTDAEYYRTRFLRNAYTDFLLGYANAISERLDKSGYTDYIKNL